VSESQPVCFGLVVRFWDFASIGKNVWGSKWLAEFNRTRDQSGKLATPAQNFRDRFHVSR